MRQQKTGTFPTAAPVNNSIEKPSEEAAAVALRDRFDAFNAGALTRSAITREDLAALDEIDALHAAYAAAAHTAWKGVKWGSDTIPDAVGALGRAIREYRADCGDQAVMTLASGRTKSWPAVEGEDFRRHLAASGVKVIAIIDAAIQAGYAREANERVVKARMESAVRYWLGEPTVRKIIVALAATQADNPELMTPRRGLLAALRTQMSVLSAATSEPREILYAHAWRRWLPLAEAVLAEESAVAAA